MEKDIDKQRRWKWSIERHQITHVNDKIHEKNLIIEIAHRKMSFRIDRRYDMDISAQNYVQSQKNELYDEVREETE